MKEKWKDYYYKGLAVFLTVAMCILFFFAVFRLKELGHYVKVIANILMPFIYGAVIAYLLTPVCNSIENYLADKNVIVLKSFSDDLVSADSINSWNRIVGSRVMVYYVKSIHSGFNEYPDAWRPMF